MSNIRELSLNEIDAVAGGADVKVGPVHILVGEKDTGIAFGIAIEGVGGFAITGAGVCGAIKGLGGGCV